MTTSAPIDEHSVADGDRDSVRLKHDASAGRDRRESEREGLGGPVDLGPHDPLEPLGPGLCLAGTRAGAPALDEPLEAGDFGGGALGLLGLNRQGKGAFLAEPGVPERPQLATAVVELQHARGDRLEEVAVVRDQHDGAAHLGDRFLEPFGALHVQVVCGLVEQQDVRTGDQSARERCAGQLAAREHRQRIGQARIGNPQPAGDACHPRAPVIPAGALERGMRPLVGGEHLRARVPAGHPGLELGQLGFGGDRVGHPLGDVFLEGATSDLQRRPLVVQGDPGALGQADPAGIRWQLTGDNPQQRGLALAVAPDDRQAVPEVNAERDLVQDATCAEALGDPNDFHKRVG